jgi:hypothetical protein
MFWPTGVRVAVPPPQGVRRSEGGDGAGELDRGSDGFGLRLCHHGSGPLDR